MKRIICLLSFTICVFIANAQEGFSFFEDNGKWGVKYNGEVCLLPRFEKVNIDEFHYGNFFYKEGDKWGIANLWETVTPALFDSIYCIPECKSYGMLKLCNKGAKSLSECKRAKDKPYISVGDWDKKPSFFEYSEYKLLFAFSRNGKWSVCNVDGKEIFDAYYDEIYPIYFNIRSLDSTVSDKKKRGFNGNAYFLVREENVCKLIDLMGTVVIDNIPSFDSFITFDNLKKYGKQLKKHEDKRLKEQKNLLSDFECHRDSLIQVMFHHTLFRSSRSYEANGYYRKDFFKELNSPRKLCAGYFNGHYLEAAGDSVMMDGFKSKITPYGFITLPLEYDSPIFRLQRNEMDVLARKEILDIWWCSSEEDINIMPEYINKYEELLEMAQSLNDSENTTFIISEIEKLKNEYQKRKKREEEEEDARRFQEKVYKIADIGTTILNAASNVVGAYQGKQDQDYPLSNLSVNSASKSSTDAVSMTVNDMQNYQSLRNTYNKWAQDLMQMKNANGRYQNGYNESDKKHAQSEMKRIRQMAESKYGKEIPYNSLEDW